MKLVKEDFRIEQVENGVYITPKVECVKRNERLDYSTKMTLKHSFNSDVSYYSNNGTLGLTSSYFSNDSALGKKIIETLLEKAIKYYNWAV